MRANVRFMMDEGGLGQSKWRVLDCLENIEDPIIPPIGGSYRHEHGKYRVNEIEYGYAQKKDGEWICAITVEVS